MQGFLTKRFAFWVLTILLLVACGQVEPTAEATVNDEEVVADTAVPEPTATTMPTTEPVVEAVVESRSGEPTIGDPYAPEMGNTGYDVQHYTIKLELEPNVETLYGDVTIDAVATIDHLGELFLDFVSYDIKSVFVDGEATEFYRKDAKLAILLPEPVAEGTPFTMNIQYSGEPNLLGSNFVGFQGGYVGIFYPENSIYALAEPDGARYWFPNNDHPRDKATFRFEFTVPLKQTAVSNGILVEVIEETPMIDGRPGHTFVWEHDHPMATYLATVAVGEYERIEDSTPSGIPIRHYTFAEEKEDLIDETAITGEAIDWMSDLFGEYPYETYGYVTVDAPGVSLETQTMVLLSTQMIDERTIIHELAHMWFGDHVSLDSWGEMWRNEGFATYLSFVWENRDDPEELDLFMAGLEQAVIDHDEEDPYVVRNPPPRQLFGFNSYVKGALIVHELRQEMGDDAFWQGLKTYFATYGGGTASDAQFQEIMEEVSGKDLDEFFTFWLDELPQG